MTTKDSPDAPAQKEVLKVNDPLTLGGTISGEHGLGWLKRGQLHRQWDTGAVGEVERGVDAGEVPGVVPGREETAARGGSVPDGFSARAPEHIRAAPARESRIPAGRGQVRSRRRRSARVVRGRRA